jgi:hypothetical protein
VSDYATDQLDYWVKTAQHNASRADDEVVSARANLREAIQRKGHAEERLNSMLAMRAKVQAGVRCELCGSVGGHWHTCASHPDNIKDAVPVGTATISEWETLAVGAVEDDTVLRPGWDSAASVHTQCVCGGFDGTHMATCRAMA